MKRGPISRRQFLKTGAAGASALAFNSSVNCKRRGDSENSATEKKDADLPNVLIIMTDQHRADLMTCAGNDLVPTPKIDRIAERGVRFSNAYCPYPVCVASRMAMLTGLYGHSTGAIDNTNYLDWRYRTLANHFTENGYLTGLVGKMHFLDAHNHGFEYYMSINDWLMYLGPKVQHYANEIANHQLYDYFYRAISDTGAGFPDVENVWEGPNPWVGHVDRFDFSSVASELEPEDHLDMFIARESAKFLQRYKDQPFFLIASFMKPHTPFYPPREFAEKYPIDKIKLPEIGDISQYPPHIQGRIKANQQFDEHRFKAGRAGYLGNLAFVDTCVGHLYQSLEDLDLIDNTIVVYTSDHGEMLGDHGIYQKFCLFEPSVKVPLIISYPKSIPQSKVSNALTEYLGLYPTLVELTGIDSPDSTTLHDFPNAAQNMDATSFAGLAFDPEAKGPDAAFSEYNLRKRLCQYMIRTKRYKYVFNHGSMHEIYDLEADPGEFINRISDSGLDSVRRELKDRLFAWFDPEKNPYRQKV